MAVEEAGGQGEKSKFACISAQQGGVAAVEVEDLCDK